MNEQENTNHWLEDLGKLRITPKYIAALTERLHGSFGIRTPHGHAEKVLIRHTQIELQPSHKQWNSQYQNAVRNLGKTRIRDTQKQCAMRYSMSLPDPDECHYLVKLFDRQGQIKTLLHDDVHRKAWFLHLCRRSWETSGHWVLGIAQNTRGRYGFEANSGIPTILFNELDKVLNPDEVVHTLTQPSHRETEAIDNKPFPINERSVLIIDNADKYDSSHLAFLMKAVHQRKAKLIFLESSKPGQMRYRTPFFHIHEHLEKLIERDRKRNTHEMRRKEEVEHIQTPKSENQREHEYDLER